MSYTPARPSWKYFDIHPGKRIFFIKNGNIKIQQIKSSFLIAF